MFFSSGSKCSPSVDDAAPDGAWEYFLSRFYKDAAPEGAGRMRRHGFPIRETREYVRNRPVSDPFLATRFWTRFWIRPCENRFAPAHRCQMDDLPQGGTMQLRGGAHRSNPPKSSPPFRRAGRATPAGEGAGRLHAGARALPNSYCMDAVKSAWGNRTLLPGSGGGRRPCAPPGPGWCSRGA